MTDQGAAQQFILLPSRGLRAFANAAQDSQGRFLVEIAHRCRPSSAAPATFDPAGDGRAIRVLDSVHEDGAKLIEVAPADVPALRLQQPGLRLLPVVYYRSAVVPRPLPKAGPSALAVAPAAVKTVVRVISQGDGKPVPRALVVAFTNFRARWGAQGETNSKGEVSLALSPGTYLQRLYVFPERGFWPLLERRVTLAPGMSIALQPIDLAYQDALRHFYGQAGDGVGAGVKVGVIDTGIAAHPDLVIEGGVNTVLGEKPEDYGDNGEGHGSHVAGIIAARGRLPTGVRGLAPAVTLRSYRVFGKNNPEASNYAILKAIDRAVEDGCDLINMSLGGGPDDPAISDAIAQARAAGSLVIVAAGNDGRQEVSFPARDSLAVAVSAMGRKGTFPRNAAETGDVRAPYGTDRKDFLAAFSNIGTQIDLTAPGVGIVSTYPGGYAVLDGTSMACPAVTGVAARLLAKRPDILSMARNQARSDALAGLLYRSAQSLGFGPIYEGHGLPR